MKLNGMTDKPEQIVNQLNGLKRSHSYLKAENVANVVPMTKSLSPLSTS